MAKYIIPDLATKADLTELKLQLMAYIAVVAGIAVAVAKIL